MRVVASREAAEFVRGQGGRLWVWTRSTRCCRARITYLQASTERRAGSFRRFGADEGFDVYVPDGLPRLPRELHVELSRFPKRHVSAFWDGCAWVE